MNIVFFGPPGAGKGTQAECIAQKYNLHIIGTGNLIREQVQQQSKLGKQAEDYMSAGKLLPDQLVNSLLEEKLKTLSASPSGLQALFDGYPRTLSQAEYLMKALADLGETLDKVFYLQIEEAALIKRLGGRFACVQCGANYHEKFHRPLKEGICDTCGSSAFQKRTDDEPQVIKQRLAIYGQESQPVLEFYHERGLLIKVDAGQSQEDVTQQIESYM